ncbi:ferrous iron transporter B [Cellulomonas composti]|uniref:Ferrous iron transporter B n=1 Tax=Cellulomonas composti TaxID=266130 RepID=A0A511JBA6_9CELL|nr:ferrous iron transporter B [Cellulomonas composti]GEL95270.1 ferrous iron transporter B [Cellulomonas composti]
MTCHDEGAAGAAVAGTALAGAPRVVLVGNPNVGKSTLFNAVTGSRQRVVNAPGTTVELQDGRWWTGGRDVRLVDLPGTYGLQARSPDEQVAADEVRAAATDLAVLVVDAAGPARSLLLVGQVALAGVPLVVALTMTDVARSRGLAVPVEHLRARLGVPVVEIDPRTGRGFAELAAAVDAALVDPPRVPAPVTDGADDGVDEEDAVFDWVAGVLADVPAPVTPVRTWSDRVDRLLLDPRVGIPVFLVVMWALFELTTTVAAPLIEGVDGLVNGWFADVLRGILPWGWLQGLLVDGVLAGVGTVLSFVPLMGLMFVAVALLEDCGYLARAAFVADRAMRGIGLDGRAVLPLVVGFGCNLPALAATRTLPHARQRLLTGLLVPFTSCTARLTVYVLLASVFFPNVAGTAIFAMYVASIALVVLGGLALRRTLFRDLQREPLVLALPAYQRPAPRAIAVSTWVRVRAFVRKAGVIIVATLTGVWVLMAIPVAGQHAFADVPVEDSLYGRTAQTVAPVFAPAGFGSWEATAALATGFVAKEVVVGSFAQTAAVAEPADPANPGTLGDRLRATFDESSGGHAVAAAAAFMWFVLAYSPCLATLAEQRRLFGARWVLFGVAVGLVVAWVGAVLVFRIGVLL